MLASLDAVDHPELLDLVELARDAADAVRGGHYRPAQALLGNVLDTAMTGERHDDGVREDGPGADIQPAPRCT